MYASTQCQLFVSWQDQTLLLFGIRAENGKPMIKCVITALHFWTIIFPWGWRGSPVSVLMCKNTFVCYWWRKKVITPDHVASGWHASSPRDVPSVDDSAVARPNRTIAQSHNPHRPLRVHRQDSGSLILFPSGPPSAPRAVTPNLIHQRAVSTQGYAKMIR